MISFILIAVVMLAAAVLVLSPALLGKSRVGDTDRTEQNVLIAQEQIAALEKDLAEAVIEQAQFEEQKAEIERNLLSDVDQAVTETTSSISQRGRVWAISLVALFTIMASTGLYLQIGTPEVMELADAPPQQAGNHAKAQGGAAPVDMEQSINKLKARLFDNPDDLEGWFLLGRSYMAMGRYQESADAMGKVYAKVQNHAGVIIAYADALAMANNGKLSGKPFELVQQALKLEPNNATGLWLAGLAYEEQGNHKQALASFKKLRPQLTDANSSAKVNELIAKMETQLGLPPSKDVSPQMAASGTVGIEVVVMASDEVMAKLSGNETVFIYAKAMQGPPMPLAAKRISVQELPITLRLDDSMAMMPQMKLSNFEQVLVGARISKSGNAIAQKGDFYKELSSIKSKGNGKVTVIVDGVVE
ncbi:MAG: c-type cytochrome biogenesis protein CcmI [Gammaproteobacteria bacterium]|nr:c-type cytochrome biogenesis protein CcmI [Gammaproteobacteria bacterium]